jgi:hypothetical protein
LHRHNQPGFIRFGRAIGHSVANQRCHYLSI